MFPQKINGILSVILHPFLLAQGRAAFFILSGALETILAGAVFPAGDCLGHRSALDILGAFQAGAVFGGVVHLAAGDPVHRRGNGLRRGRGLYGGLGRGGGRRRVRGGGGGAGRRSRGGRRGGGRSLLGQQLGLDQHLFRVVEDGRDLGTGGGALGVQFSVHAVDDPVISGPLQGLHRPRVNSARVGKIVVKLGVEAGVVAGALGVVVQHGGRLLPGDGVLRAEFPVSQAGHNAVFRGPVDPAGIVIRGQHVVKPGAGVLRGVDAGHVAQHGDEHAPGHGDARAKLGFAHAVEQALLRGVVHMGVVPGAFRHVGKLLRAGGGCGQHRGGHQQCAGEQKGGQFIFHGAFLVSLYC